MNEAIEFLSPLTPRLTLALIGAVIASYVAVRFSWGRANKLSNIWPIYVIRGLLFLGLLSLFLNPVRVTEKRGSIEPSQVFYLLDASESMALGNEQATRWDQAIGLIRDSAESAYDSAAARISLFRFGRRLKAVDSPDVLGLQDQNTDQGMGISFKEKSTVDQSEDEFATPEEQANEPDTQMFVALRQISSRFGRKPPAAVVVFSDGRARDATQVEHVAAAFKKLEVPVYCVPVGNTESRGDVALVSLVTPLSARKQSEVQAHAFLRSYGFDGRQVEVKLLAINEMGKPSHQLANVPLTLRSGFQSVPITFRTTAQTQAIQAQVTELPNEVSTDNNQFDSEIEITREKIRVLYVEGSRRRSVPTVVNGMVRNVGPTSSLQEALQADDDIECRSLPVSVANVSFNSSSQLQSFPQSVAELSSFDAIILSDVPARIFSSQQLEWIDTWVRQRGSGLCMVGGSNSYGAGDWHETVLKKILPVTMQSQTDWRSDVKVRLQPDLGSGVVHPFFRFARDDVRNRQIAAEFPGFHGVNIGLTPKPNFAKVLAVAIPGALEAPPAEQQEEVRRSPLFSAQGLRELFTSRKEETTDPQISSGELPPEFAAITVGRYGKGRTMAMPMPITGAPAQAFLKWGSTKEGNERYGQFWRNAVYWLTEQSYIGRRRLVATADKRYYGPADTITLSGAAFDESANETSVYRLSGVIEPQSFDNIESEFSTVRWPNNVPRPEQVDSPFIMWGEEFEIPVKKVAGRNIYQIELELADTLSSGANQSIRVELTAYEDQTQVDSTSVPIQILHDPFEQQNPFPDHELLTKLAEASGGRLLKDESDISEMLSAIPVQRGPSELSKAPIWSKWWVMLGLIGLVSADWCYRRWIGLA